MAPSYLWGMWMSYIWIHPLIYSLRNYVAYNHGICTRCETIGKPKSEWCVKKIACFVKKGSKYSSPFSNKAMHKHGNFMKLWRLSILTSKVYSKNIKSTSQRSAILQNSLWGGGLTPQIKWMMLGYLHWQSLSITDD